MSILDKILKFLWPDERSDLENKQERLFIDAANELENYYLTDQGRLSMDPEEARKALLRFAQQNKNHSQVGITWGSYRLEYPCSGMHGGAWIVYRRLDMSSSSLLMALVPW